MRRSEEVAREVLARAGGGSVDLPAGARPWATDLS